MSESSPNGSTAPLVSRRALRERAAQVEAETASLPAARFSPVGTEPRPATPPPVPTWQAATPEPARVVRRTSSYTTGIRPAVAPVTASTPFAAPDTARGAAPLTPPVVPFQSSAPSVRREPEPVSVAIPEVIEPVAEVAEVAEVRVAGQPAIGVPPWDAITTGKGGIPVTAAPVTKARRGKGKYSEQDRVPPRSAGYTWLQYLILIIVAFILGLLLWQLISGEQLFGPNTASDSLLNDPYLILETLL